MYTILLVLLDKLLIQRYHKIEKKMPPTLIKQSPKLYVATLLEYLDPLGIVLCLLVIYILGNPSNYGYFRHHLRNNFENNR